MTDNNDDKEVEKYHYNVEDNNSHSGDFSRLSMLKFHIASKERRIFELTFMILKRMFMKMDTYYSDGGGFDEKYFL